jgi:hypothetical protein
VGLDWHERCFYYRQKGQVGQEGSSRGSGIQDKKKWGQRIRRTSGIADKKNIGDTDRRSGILDKKAWVRVRRIRPLDTRSSDKNKKIRLHTEEKSSRPRASGVFSFWCRSCRPDDGSHYCLNIMACDNKPFRLHPFHMLVRKLLAVVVSTAAY